MSQWFFPLAVWLASVALLVSSASAQTFGNAATHKIQVRDDALAKQIEADGGRLIADYGSYRLYETTNVAANLIGHAAAEMRDGYNSIFLHAGHLDTRKPEVKALRKSVGNFSGKHLHLVQFAGPVQPQWRDELLAAGVTIVNYIPENSYLVYGDAASLARAQAFASVAPHVQWEGTYLDDYKLHPSARPTDTNGNPRDIGTELFDIQLMADDTANAATLQLLDQLKLEPILTQSRVLHYLNVVVHLNPKDLARVAAQPEVVAILPYYPRHLSCERQDQIIAGNLTAGIPNGPGYLAWLGSLGFTQAQFTSSGFVVDMSDSGIDNGTQAPGHFGLYTGGNVTNASRVVYNRLVGTPNSGSTLQGCDGHGNLNSHIVGGYDDFSGFPFADASGFHYGLGVCPFVKVGSSVIFDPNYTSPNYNTLQSTAYGSGARISNNSWGSTGGTNYDSQAQNYDTLVRDAQSSVAGNQEMVIVFAAGNAGPGADTVESPGNAKNIISVGAGENVQAFGGADNSGITDSEADSAEDIIFFSSRGPCPDGRNKPDLVAPGTHVSGGVFQATNDFVNFPDGDASSCFNGSGVSGGPGGSIYWPLSQTFYTASSGTSHSTPCVSGACALLRQYFINNFTNPPSAAMTKAFLVNSTRYMTGASANDTLPSPAQGMGELNIGTAFDGEPRMLRDEVAADLFTASGQARSYFGMVADTNHPFRVTVAWTDAPGAISGNAYNNNLDLTVTINGNTYKGNVFSGAFSTTGGTADVKNNVECVFLPAGVSGVYQVTVTGTSINSIGVPNSGNALEQDFALVVYNTTNINVPTFIPSGTALTAESCTPTNGAIDPGETVTLNFSVQNVAGVSSTNLVGTLLATGGVMLPSSPQTFGVVAGNGGIATQPFTFTAAGTCGGTITATLQLQDGASTPTNVSFTLPLGMLTTNATFTQNFDGVTAPNLPAGWTTTNSGAGVLWVTTTVSNSSAPNSVFAPDPASPGDAALISPSIPILSSNAVLSFRHKYKFETGFDGGVLEIQLGNGAFADIVTAGGSFVSGGYNRTISSTTGNPIGGRSAWSGSQTAFTTVTAKIPPAAAGQNIHLKWRLGSDTGTSSTGWFVDTMSITDVVLVCCSDTADLSVAQTAAPQPAVSGSNLTFNIAFTNLGPLTASNVTVSDTLPAGVSLVSASPGFVNVSNTLTWSLGSVTNGATTNFTITVTPSTNAVLTNSVTTSSTTPDFNLANNSAQAVLAAVAVPRILFPPFSSSPVAGSTVSMAPVATGGLLNYQWLFNGTNISGATLQTLTITNILPNQSGTYTVVVTNMAGSTNALAQVTVNLPSLLINVSSTNVSILMFGAPGVSYTLQYKNALTDAVWTSILPAVTATNAAVWLQDPSPSASARFYRVTFN